MNKKSISVIIFIILVIVGVALLMSNSKNSKSKAVQKENFVPVLGAGSYEPYAPEKIAMKAGSGKVVLFFRASWCPTCRALDRDIKANLGNIPEKLTILDVDYDNSNELKKKYGVTYQHTMVEVDIDGNMIKKWMGSPTLDSFIKEVI